MFTLRGSAVVLFHVTIPVHMQFPRPGPLSISAPQAPSFILKRVFFKYYCFTFN